MDKYILLVDPNPEILELEATALRYFYGGEIIKSADAQSAIETLKAKGKPEILFIELALLESDAGALHEYLSNEKAIFPVIASSDDPEAYNLLKKFSVVSGLLEKPVSVKAFTYLVKGMITSPVETPSHVPIDIKTVLDLACNNFDLFLKLSGTNFVKIIGKDDVFSYLDAQKLMAKGIKELHILASDTVELLNSWEKNFKMASMEGVADLTPQAILAIDSLENIEKISRSMGWTREVIASVQKTINLAVGVLSKDVKLNEALKKKLANRSSNYSHHVGLLSFLNCAYSTQLGWTGESGQLKLVMASLMHDLALDENYYDNIKEWNSRASNSKDRSPETTKYRLHPIHAAKLASMVEILPPDVEQIILQHHEKKDGSGFPRGLNYNRISHLGTMFIMVEDLVDFIGDGDHLETSLADYITWGQSYYDQGNFKKIFEKLRSLIPRS